MRPTMRPHSTAFTWRAPVLALVAILGGTGVAVAQERLSMPYSCGFSGGRLYVEPAPEQSYAIVGRREQEAFEICAPNNPSRCRTWQLHRFEIECDGGRAGWISVVGAAPAQRGRQLWVQNDRLHVRLRSDRFGERGRPCLGLPWRGPGERFEGMPGFGDCDSYRPRERAVSVLPAGFAPLMQLGARIMASPAPPFRLEEPPREVGPQMSRPRFPSRQEPRPEPRQDMAGSDRPPLRPFGSDERPGPAPQGLDGRQSTPHGAEGNPPVARGPAPAQREAAVEARPRAGAPRVLAEGPMTSAPARSEAPKTETPKTDTANPRDTPKPVEVTKPIVRPVETSKPAEAAKPPTDTSWQAAVKVEPRPAASAPMSRSEDDDRGPIDAIVASLHRNAPFLLPLFAAMLALSLGLIAWRLLRRAPDADTDAPEAAAEREAIEEPVWPDLGGISAPAPTRAAVEDLMRNADDFYVHVKDLVGQMPDTNPLRDVVTDELAAIDAALRAPDLMQAYAVEDWTRLRQCAVQALTDLERIRRIVQGAKETAAVAALAAPAPPAERLGHPVPTTRDEALAVLGVNAEASEKVIKKIVDAMRQTWHPDHARNDLDRRAREERMKQINIAWDILRPKRQAA
jgi:hypothetical protein